MQVNYLTTASACGMSSVRDGVAGGDSLGYATGQTLMRRAFLSAGIKITDEAKIWISYLPIHMFEKTEGKINVLFSMWEADDLPPEMIKNLNKADYVIVPSRNSMEVFKRAGYKNRIFICHHGVDTDLFTYKERIVEPGRAIRFLWVGAPNSRKGYDLAVKAFFNAFHGTDAKVELYLKSTKFGSGGDFQFMPQHNAVVDTRKLPREELVQLYHDSEVFLFPSRGEGAGLPPLEAMATGMPVIAPSYSAMRDYMFPEFSYPCQYTMIPVEYGCDTHSANCDLTDLIKLCRYIYRNLPEAFSKGKKASEFVRQYFTVEKMGDNLTWVINEIMKKEGINE